MSWQELQDFQPLIRFIDVAMERSLIVQMKRLLCMVLAVLLLPMCALAEEAGLAQGSTGEPVVQMQKRLMTLGLLGGEADGIYGAQTAAAVREAQRLLQAAGYELEPTGAADAKTLALLYDESAAPALGTLRRGSKGARVTQLQNRLIDLKLLSTMADGDYGSRTEAAVLAFQQQLSRAGVKDVLQDGVASPVVQQWLQQDVSDYGFRAPIYFDDTQPLALTADALYAPACILIDAPSGEVLFEHNADTRMYPASTTKIMSLIVALENGQLDASVTVPASAADVPADSSLVPVTPGEEMRMIDLLYGLMIRSGNDAANAVAELCAGSIDDFVIRMNQRAQQLGMTGTHFTNPHGYHDENHYSTARDLAVLTRLGLTDPVFCQIATCLSYTLPATQKRDALVLQNSYEIFNPASTSYIPGAAGVKSGYTSLAGFCYVGAAQREGRTLIAVILGVPGRDRGWQDLSRLFEYGFALSY